MVEAHPLAHNRDITRVGQIATAVTTESRLAAQPKATTVGGIVETKRQFYFSSYCKDLVNQHGTFLDPRSSYFWSEGDVSVIPMKLDNGSSFWNDYLTRINNTAILNYKLRLQSDYSQTTLLLQFYYEFILVRLASRRSYNEGIVRIV